MMIVEILNHPFGVPLVRYRKVKSSRNIFEADTVKTKKEKEHNK